VHPWQRWRSTDGAHQGVPRRRLCACLQSRMRDYSGSRREMDDPRQQGHTSQALTCRATDIGTAIVKILQTVHGGRLDAPHLSSHGTKARVFMCIKYAIDDVLMRFNARKAGW